MSLLNTRCHPESRRPAVWRRARLGLVLGLLFFGVPAAAWAQEESWDETELWVPSIGGSIGLFVRDTQGSLSNSLRPVGAPNTTVSDDGAFIDPIFGVSFELMTPALTSSMGRPRLFAHAGVSVVVGSLIKLAEESSPGKFDVPESILVPGMDDTIVAAAVGGQGARTEAEVQPLVVSAGMGVAFTLDLWERRLRLKPSVEYIQETIKGTGVVKHVGSDRVIVSGVIVQDFDLIRLRAEKERTFHGIGAGLELELDATRAGPFLVSLFVNTRVHRILGNGSLDFAASNGTDTANWSVEADPWRYRLGLGLRFRFAPER